MASSVIGALRVNLGLDSAQFTKGVKGAQTDMQRLGRNMQKIGAAVSAVGAGIALAVRGQLNAADEIGKSAQSLGITTEALSQLGHAANMSGSSMAGLSTGLRALSRNMVDNEDRFGALGIAVRDASGEMRPTEAVLADLSDVLAGMPDGAEKTALAMELMGKSGAELIPMLNGGAQALRGMMEEADRLGLTISQDTAEAAAQFNDNLARLGGTVRGWVVIITSELAPVLAKITDGMVAASAAFQGMSPVMRQVAAAVAAFTVVAGPVIIGLGTLLVTGKALLAPFAGIAGLLAGAVKAAFVGLAVVVGAVGLPVTLLIAGVAALTAGVIAFWPEIKQLTAAFLDLADRGINYAKEKLDELLQFVTGLGARMFEAGSNVMKGLGDGIKSGISGAWSGIKGSFDRVLDYLPNRAEIRSPSRLFARFGRFILDGLGLGIQDGSSGPVAAMQGVTDQMSQGVEKFASGFASFVGPIVNRTQTISGAFANMAQRISDSLLNSGLSTIGRALGGALGIGSGSGFGGFLGRIFGGFRANGGPVSSGRSYVVGEEGPELFTPGASGQITSNENLRGGGGQLVIRLDLSSDVEARIMQNTSGQAVQIVRSQVPPMIGSAFGRAREQGAF